MFSPESMNRACSLILHYFGNKEWLLLYDCNSLSNFPPAQTFHCGVPIDPLFFNIIELNTARSSVSQLHNKEMLKFINLSTEII